MKKDKEWLKEELSKLAETADLIAGTTMINDTILLNKGQEKAYLNAIDLSDQLDEPELPAILQFVAEWIEEEKRNSASYVGMMLRFHNMDLNAEINGYINRNYETFARALLLDDYTIEKQPRWIVFYVSDKSKCFKDFNGINGFVYSGLEEAIKFDTEEKAKAVALLTDGQVVEVSNV